MVYSLSLVHLMNLTNYAKVSQWRSHFSELNHLMMTPWTLFAGRTLLNSGLIIRGQTIQEFRSQLPK
jgi:hypothetical protein